MKNKAKLVPLFAAVFFAFLLLFASGFNHLREDSRFPDDSELIKLLQLRDPENFWQQMSEICGKKEVDHQLIYSTFSRFEQIAPGLSGEDRVSIDAIKGSLLASLRYFGPALVDLKHVVANSRSVAETRKALMIMSEIYARNHDFSALQRTAEQLRASGEAFRTNVPDNIQELVLRQRAYYRLYLPYYLAVWLLLLIFPAAITEIERRTWMKKYSDRADQRGPYIAFMYSPMCQGLVVVSGLVFLAVQMPVKLGLSGKYAFLCIHLFLVWLFCQWPLFNLENQVKKLPYGMGRYCFDKLRLLLINHFSLIAVAITFFILHVMVDNMPIWPVLRPVGATVAPPAIFALCIIVLQWLLPGLLGCKSFVTADLTNRVLLAGKGFRRGVLDIGSLSFNSGPIVFGGLENELDKDEFALLLERSDRKANAGWLFFDFLLLILFAMAAAMMIAYDPFAWSSFFLAGPGFIEALLLLALGVFCNSTRKRFARIAQFSVDSEFAAEGRSELLIRVLERVNALNFFPESLREGDRNEFDTMSLDEARLKLRSADGMYFPSASHPDCSVLVALWRSRLAIDWKLGSEEAVYLTSLDYAVNGENSADEMRSLAARHSRIGAECIYKSEKQELAITFCCQKFSAFSSETPLPQEKICEICSEAMKKALHFGPYCWRNTQKGCVLFRQPS